MIGQTIAVPQVLGLRGPGLTDADRAALAATAKQATDANTAAQQAKTDAQAAAGSIGAATNLVVGRALPSDRNLFDPSKATANAAVAVSGNLNTGANGYTATNYMYVGNGNQFVVDKPVFGGGGAYGFAFFSRYGDASSFVAGTAGDTAANTPITAKADYVLFSVAASDAIGMQVIIGAATPTRGRDFAMADEATVATIAASQARAARPVVFDLFNPQDTLLGYQLGSDGSLNANASANTTGFIACEPGVPITPSFEFFAGNTSVGFVWYDRLMRRVGSTPNGGANVPVIPSIKAAFFRTSFYATQRGVRITNGALGAGAIVIGWSDVLRRKPFAGGNLITAGDSIMAGSAIGISIIPIAVAAYLGATLQKQSANGGWQMSDVLTNCTQADFATCDLFICNAATNSWGSHNSDGSVSTGRPLGTLGDLGSAGTFYGDLHRVYVEQLQAWMVANNRKFRMVQATPLKRFDYGVTSGDPANAQGIKLSTYADAVKAFCRAYGVRCLDLFYDGDLNAVTADMDTIDRLHPTLAYSEQVLARTWTSFCERM